MLNISSRTFRAMIAPKLRHFAVSGPAIDAVVAAYAEPWRSYHTRSHVAGMLIRSHFLPLEAEQQMQLSLLIIYHDVWYKIGREKGENERRSADWAIDDLKDYPGDKDLHFALVRQGIEATINHSLDGVEPRFTDLVAWLLDLDLWGLGKSPAQFQEDTGAIWMEFAPRFTREEFDLGRAAWATSFLERPVIYHTSEFSRFEGPARHNLRALAGV